jgi:hypothetical protein
MSKSSAVRPQCFKNQSNDDGADRDLRRYCCHHPFDHRKQLLAPTSLVMTW